MNAINQIKADQTNAPLFYCKVFTPKHGWVSEDRAIPTEANPYGFFEWGELLELASTLDGDFSLDNITDVRVTMGHNSTRKDVSTSLVKKATEIWASQQDVSFDELTVPEWMDYDVAERVVKACWSDHRAHQAHNRSYGRV